MANKIQFRRGIKANLPTLSAGEPAFCTDTKEVFIGDGTANKQIGGWGGIGGTLSSQTDLQAALDVKAPLASPALSGTPTAPTAATADNTAQIATTAFVKAQGFTANTGTVTSVAAGNGMSFTSITGSGSVTLGTPSNVTSSSTNSVSAGTHTHALDNSGVTAGSYTSANITVDIKGRVTAASNGSGGVNTLDGSSSFNSTSGRTISHSIGSTNYRVMVTPTASTGGMLGEVYVTKATNGFTVYNTGSSNAAFDYFVKY